MKLFLAPHNDDETLFGAFTIIRENPVVCVVFDSHMQQIPAGAGVRRQETMLAMQELCAKSPVFLGMPDNDPIPLLKPKLQHEFPDPEHVWAPAIEQDGHFDHSLVGRIADEIWPGKVTHYLTYRRGIGKSRSRQEVPYEPEWILRKLRALACYSSQIINGRLGCYPWFLEDLREYCE